MNVMVSFSARKQGNCSKILDFCSKIMKNTSVFSFSDFSVSPCGSCDYECFRSREACPHIHDMEFRILDAICRADSAVFIVPNYCDYPNANFFIFNERSNCYFQGHPELLDQYLKVPKKFVVISNTFQTNFREAFLQHTDQEPDILFLSAKSFGKSSISGDILESAEAVSDLETFLIRDSN